MSDQLLSNLEHLRTLGECLEEKRRENFVVQHLELQIKSSISVDLKQFGPKDNISQFGFKNS